MCNIQQSRPYSGSYEGITDLVLQSGNLQDSILHWHDDIIDPIQRSEDYPIIHDDIISHVESNENNARSNLEILNHIEINIHSKNHDRIGNHLLNMANDSSSNDQITNHFEIEVDVINDTQTCDNTTEMIERDKEIMIAEDKEFHLFLSHSSQDEEEVIKVLEILEAAPYNLTCCIDRRDFMLGETTMANINYALNKSMGTVFFLTKNFIESDYCNHEKQAAYSMYLEGESRVIPVILQPCNVPDEFRSIHYIDESFPETIAEKIYKCLTIDPKDFKTQLPLQPIQAGTNRVNGSRFEMIDTPLQTCGNLRLLTPHCKREFERRAIKATEKFSLLIQMIESLPVLKECYRKSTKYIGSGVIKVLVFATLLKSLIVANTVTIVYCGCEGFFNIGVNLQNWNCEVQFASGSIAITLGVWLLAILATLLWRNLDIHISVANVKEINRLSVPNHQCCFYLKVSEMGKIQLTAIKYDLKDCKAHTESQFEELEPLESTFDDFWKWTVSSNTYKDYFERLGMESLPHADEIRHQVVHEKLCFCQYLELNDRFGKFKMTSKHNTNNRDNDRTRLLRNNGPDENIIV